MPGKRDGWENDVDTGACWQGTIGTILFPRRHEMAIFVCQDAGRSVRKGSETATRWKMWSRAQANGARWGASRGVARDVARFALRGLCVAAGCARCGAGNARPTGVGRMWRCSVRLALG